MGGLTRGAVRRVVNQPRTAKPGIRNAAQRIVRRSQARFTPPRDVQREVDAERNRIDAGQSTLDKAPARTTVPTRRGGWQRIGRRLV